MSPSSSISFLASGSVLLQLRAGSTAEYRFRRNGLVVSLAFMVLLAVAIYLKIREIESRE